jgi:hypothetical protein
MTLLNYNGKNVLGICMAGGDIVRLLPGINEVSEIDFKSMKSMPLFQSRLRDNLIQVLDEGKEKDGKRTIEEMLSYIPKIFDTKLLKKILETDGRDKVIKAANMQLENIKNPSKAKEEASDEHFR